MQTDPFAAGAEPVDDPFATTPAAPATPQATPPAPDTPATTGNTGAVTGDVPDGGTVETGDSGGTPAEQPPAEAVPAPVPTVNREGEAVEVEPEPGHTAPSEAAVAEVAPGPLETTPEDQGTDPAATDNPQPPEPGAVPAQAPEQSAAQQPVQSEPRPAEAPAEAPAQPEAAPAPQAAPQASPAPAASNDGNGDDDGKKKKQQRHYVLLMQTSVDGFTKIDLKGKEYTEEIEEEDGTKNVYLVARNNDHAYKLAYHLVGSPRDGATLLPLPKASWRPRRVAPAPPQPERERLVIQ